MSKQTHAQTLARMHGQVHAADPQCHPLAVRHHLPRFLGFGKCLFSVMSAFTSFLSGVPLESASVVSLSCASLYISFVQKRTGHCLQLQLSESDVSSESAGDNSR